MEGFALLGSHLGDPDRKILTPPQIRTLTERMAFLKFEDAERELDLADLKSLGYGEPESRRILGLLEDQQQLRLYLEKGRKQNCFLLTRGETEFPSVLRSRLGGECPSCLFYNGDPEILKGPRISLVGSRELRDENAVFAREAGRQAALHGLTLVSGNARGADRTAQEACLQAGGTVISVVADELCTKRGNSRILYLSQEDFDAPFSAARALSRNRVIHSLGILTIVSQCSLRSGGTWNGTVQNLKNGWSLCACFRDGSEASLALQDLGAYLIDLEDLSRLTEIKNPQLQFF